VIRSLVIAGGACALLASVAGAAPTRTSPLVIAPNGVVFVVNPDSNTVARLDFSGIAGALTQEAAVGTYPRTVTVAGTWVYTADETSDGITRCDQADLGNCTPKSLGVGCGPYGVVATPAGDRIVVSCQGTSEVVVLSTDMTEQARVKLAWPKARAIAVSSDGSKAYVTHFLTEEPGTDGHVSVVDLGNKSVANVFTVAADFDTCETQNSGQGVLNLLSAIALMPDGAPADVAGQLWVGGTQENNVSKGLFKREARFKDAPGSAMFPLAKFASFPEDGISRNVYRASFHDITRFGIVKLKAADGAHVGKIDIDEANNATDIEFSADGQAAYVVDLMFNSFHIFNTRRGQGADVTTLFAGPSARGPGGAASGEPCLQDALSPITSEQPFRVAPQAQISVIEGYDPVDQSFQVVPTGVDFDAATYFNAGVSRMRQVPDGIGTSPIGVRLSPAGDRVYVFNYLARNVVATGAALPLGVTGKPENFRCASAAETRCGTNNDCPAGVGFCNHPGGSPCTTDADCGTSGPCVTSAECVPLLLGPAVSTITGRCEGGAEPPGTACKVDADCTAGGACNGIAGDPLAPKLLDGKILFNTAARDASVPNGVGLGQAAPLFNGPRLKCAGNPAQPCMQDEDCGGAAPCNVAETLPGEIVSTSHDASYVTCTSCHADFGGQDGRTWDFSQFGASLRNTMDLRGRAGFAPGTCSNAPAQECFFDAACGDGNTCRANPAMIPPNVTDAADRARWFNPMLTVHWNGDRDEVEDFEHTFRQLQGSGDCDSAEEFISTCQGALIQRSPLTSTDPADVSSDLGRPNRNIPGPLTGKNVGIRLSNMADFVYSLTTFVKNPNQPNEVTDRGRALFNDPVTQCADCHNGGPGAGKQFFTDKRPNPDFNTALPGRADSNNPFIRHDVGTANLFDTTNPLAVALDAQIFQNSRIPIPGERGSLGDYVTPVLNDLWNTAPYLHDGSAHTLLDVVRPCDSALDDCLQAGRGRNLHTSGQGRHGKTDVLTPKQLNDLTAFQNALTTQTLLGARQSVVKAGAMTVKSVRLNFGKVKKGVRKPGRFAISGTLSAPPAPIDPASGVTVQVATPGGGTMVILERALTMSGRGKRFKGKSSENGAVALKLKTAKDGSFKFTLVGKKLALGALDTGNADLTVAFETSGAQFVRNRALVAKKGTYRLPRRRG
jgi:DNA-binding beta-propeller fold protein YncE